MDLALLRTFVTVHRAGSFTRAAALLGLSQPAVTAQIRTLERQVGRPLFLRQARGVTATSFGDELAHKATPHLDALMEIAQTGFADEGALRTLHLVGPPEFLSERALPALTSGALELILALVEGILDNLPAILEAAGLTRKDDLIRYVHHDANKAKIATLAPAVTEAARKGDPLALDILRIGAEELTLLVKSVVGQSPQIQNRELVLAGGVMEHDEIVTAKLKENLASEIPDLTVSSPKRTAMEGACTLAKNIGIIQ